MKIISICRPFLKSNVNIIILTLVVATIFINIIGGLTQDFFTNNESHNLVLMILQQIVLVGLVVFFVSRKIIDLKKITSRKLEFIKIIKAFLKTYFYLLVLGIGISSIQSKLGGEIPGFGSQENIFDLFPADGIGLFITVFIATIVAPIVEELIFRGGLYEQLTNKNSRTKAAIISSLIFSLIHFQFNVAGALFVLSLIITNLYIRTGSIYIPILFHIINNTLKTIITL